MPPQLIFVGMVADIIEKASTCVKCGECEKRCPYKLPIREMLEEEVGWYRAEKKRYEEGAAS
jgi:predicted aldo/keto reductase-like oxidoreductase